MSSITYKGPPNGPIKVHLEGKHVGAIVKLAYGSGWVYGPKGAPKGEKFPTLQALKQSLEAV